MASTRTRLLFVAATVLSGILAGGIIDRAIVGGPAWQELSTEAWAQYSRHADLGTGLVAYPIEGIGAALLIIAATLSNYFDRDMRRVVMIPLYCAVVFSVSGLLLTAKVAPVMLGLVEPQSTSAIQRAFDEFFLWGLHLRGATDTLAFIAMVWASSKMNR